MTDFHFSNDFTRNIDAMVYTCGYEDCKPGHSYGPAIRSGYIVHYILKGKGFFSAETKFTVCIPETPSASIPMREFTMKQIPMNHGLTAGSECVESKSSSI